MDHLYSNRVQTPWGEPSSITKIAEGVIWVDTPGHGGLGIRDDRVPQLLSEAAICIGEWSDYWLWFEEDCDFAVPALEHPEWFPDLERSSVEATVRRWHPEYFGADPICVHSRPGYGGGRGCFQSPCVCCPDHEGVVLSAVGLFDGTDRVHLTTTLGEFIVPGNAYRMDPTLTIQALRDAGVGVEPPSKTP